MVETGLPLVPEAKDILIKNKVNSIKHKGYLKGTRDMGHGTWDMGHGTWDMGHGTWDMGHGTRDKGKSQRRASPSI